MGDVFTVQDITGSNWKQFRDLTNSVLGINYPDEFFQEVFNGKNIERNRLLVVGKVVVLSNEVVAGIKGFSLTGNQGVSVKPTAVYIEVLVVAERFRRLGLGVKLLECVEKECRRCYIRNLCVHTPSTNVEAIAWYLKRGFHKKTEVQEYYRNVFDVNTRSSTAVVLQKYLA